MEKMTENTNPLNKYFRQATVYIKLPSGLQYPANVIEPTQTGELAIQPMTAMDEIKFKTPDALMNGQGVVDVIQSCIPQIKDAWQIVSYDIDAVFLGIRIATYGETMDVTYTMPNTTEQRSHTINLPAFLEDINRQKIEHLFKIKELTFHVAPLTYKDMNLVSLETFQQQRIYASLRDTNIKDEDKVKTTEEDIKKGAPVSYEVPVTFDTANFFV
jgi:hypothetical protein